MSLTKLQKGLVENLLMVIDEEIETWAPDRAEALNMILKEGFNRIKNSLHHKKNDYGAWPGVVRIARITGREVRKARAYIDISSNNVIEVLDIVYDILKKDER